jgi:Tol biopolymer transport system component
MFRAPWKHLIVVDLATKDQKTLPLAGEYTFISHAEWSPNGELLVAVTDYEGKVGFHTLPVDGGEQHLLLSEPGVEAPSFSPRGDALYYIRGSLTAAADSTLMRQRIDPRSGAPLGAPETVLTGLDANGMTGISPDGQRLYVSRGSSIAHLWTVDLPASPGEQKARAERVTTTARSRTAFAISPDGKVAVVAELDAGAKLRIIPLDGGAPRDIACTRDVAVVHALAWSPDGTELAMVGTDPEDGRYFLYRLPVSGGKPSKSAFVVSEDLAWAPHSRILVQAEGNQNFHVVDPAASQTHHLLRELDGWLFTPQIAPDGKTAAFWWNRKSEAGDGIWMMSLADGSSRLLAKTSDMPVGFTPDGTSVYAIGPSGSDTALVAISVATGVATTVAKLPFVHGTFMLSVVPGTSRFVALVQEGGADLWVAEGFDPEAAVR